MNVAPRPSKFPHRWPVLARPRPPSSIGEWVAAAVVAFFSLLLAFHAVRFAAAWAVEFWFLAPIPLALAAAIWTVRDTNRERHERARRARMAAFSLTKAEIDALSPLGFELATRDLMIRDGIRARHVGQRGDQAADVIGRCQTTGKVWVAQCKHTTTRARVGSQVIYQVSGTAKPIHRADIVVIITNGGFTRDAIANATQLGIHLIDGDTLNRWAGQGLTLHQTLGIRHTQPVCRSNRPGFVRR